MKLSRRFFYLRAVWGNTFLIRDWYKELDDRPTFDRALEIATFIALLRIDRKFFWSQIFAKEPI